MPAILRNTRLSATAIWGAAGIAVLTTVYSEYLWAPVLAWFVSAFENFSSVNIFAALAGNRLSILQSLPMILAWVAISLTCYSLYLFSDYIWGLVKTLVPIEVSVITKKNSIFDNLVLLNFGIRLTIVLSVLALIPLAIFVVHPLSEMVVGITKPFSSDLAYRAFYTFLASFPVWFAYYLLASYALALISYEQNEVILDEEHNPLLGEDDEESEE